MEEAQRTWDATAPTYQKLKKNRATNEFKDENLDAKLTLYAMDQPKKEIIEELIAARRIRRKADQKRLELRQAELAEEENTRKAEEEGTMSECGCCMGDYPINRMVHCDSDEMHWFCRGCALKTAETEIENARYEIKCMSMDGCEGGFSLEQRYVIQIMSAFSANQEDLNFWTPTLSSLWRETNRSLISGWPVLRI